MRRLVLVAAPLALALSALAACGNGSGDYASDPGAQQPSPEPMPTAIPAAPGPVSTSLVTVMQKGDDTPQLCFGPVEQSYPPQCTGYDLVGWAWKDHPVHDNANAASWGQFALSGTWDGTAFTVDGAVPGALYDPMRPGASPTPPTPAKAYGEDDLKAIQQSLTKLPGFLDDDYDATTGHVSVDVVYDDGSLQQWADDTYGANVVLVTSALTDQAADASTEGATDGATGPA